ncbi:MAG: sulfite exporter TauE/SafE family protein [Actinomycetota bacterium]|nr:sulfite exporter TauE/SafE family protein [Actinomycetota bacterium]
MGIDGTVVLAGALTGLMVGLTGTGGGALATPLLVLLIGVSPGAAVSSDVVASLFTKPVGGLVHVRRRTVHWPIVRWLSVGSVPSALVGAVAAHELGTGPTAAHGVEVVLGGTLALSVAGVVARSLVGRRRPRGSGGVSSQLAVRRAPTLAIGALGGLAVGATSVGSGSLVVAALMLLYPGLAGRELVGTDLVQSVPLVASAALGQALFGDVRLGVTLSLLLGSLPATYLGSRVSSSRTTGAYLRPVLAAALALSSMKLLGAGSRVVASALALLACGALAETVRRGVARARGRACGPPLATRGTQDAWHL